MSTETGRAGARRKRADPAPGQIVRVVFRDHVEDGDETFLFEVFGRVARVGPHHYTIDAWTYADADKRAGMDREAERHNIKSFNILKAVVTGLWVIREEAAEAQPRAISG